MPKKKIRVGFDFDGVIAYNPFRVFRYPTTLLKKYLKHETSTKFYFPKTKIEQWLWILIHETSFFPAIGTDDLHQLIRQENIEAYIITSRYACLENTFFRWLKRHKLDRGFKGYYLNKKNEQPHLFKERMIKELEIDYFIDDNLDIVEHLNRNAKTEIHWIYNIVDRFHPYPRKHPHLLTFVNFIKSKLES